eukprot:TRINITY_DN3005_c0_g5_i1.p1 TRINITY_DN3005_c0_g5~~TRINITY_DN3005_c0_g5_i1.p1  ORF type:complete len:2318 (+),score=1139.76 TRINITY_DN3005_c0_g5_i1:183-7136(+)
MTKDKKKDAAENIKVLVRCRPLSQKELEKGYKSSVDLNLASSEVCVRHVVGDPDRWTFDAVINNTLEQKDIFSIYITPMIDSVMNGFNSTIFAYGQSGSGKTFTMTGKLDDPIMAGVIPRSFDQIFDFIRESSGSNVSWNLYCSFLELHNGLSYDLLDKNMAPLKIKENKDKTFFVQNLSQPQVKMKSDLLKWMDEGTERRRVAATDLNADSSRSHSIFTVYVQREDTTDDGDKRSVTSKLNLVDLAGSERQSKTGTTGDALKEGCNINLSLSALGTVIDTIVKGRGHIPFRSSPLTMLLKDSLGGGSKTTMFANINPSEHNVSETVSTLRFADRAKQIKNKPLIQMDAKDQKIADLTAKVEELKEKIQKYESGGGDDLEEENQRLQDEMEQLEVERNDLQNRIDLEAAAQKEERDSMTAELEKLRNECREANADKELLDTELNVAREQLRQGEQQMIDLRQIITKFICTATQPDDPPPAEPYDTVAIEQGLETATTELKSRGGASEEELAEKDALLEETQREHDKERDRLNHLNSQAQESLQQALARMDKLKKQLDDEKQKRKTRLSEKDKDIDEIKEAKDNEIEKLKRMMAEMETKMIGDIRRSESFGREGSQVPYANPGSPRAGLTRLGTTESVDRDHREAESLRGKLASAESKLAVLQEELEAARKEQGKAAELTGNESEDMKMLKTELQNTLKTHNALVHDNTKLAAEHAAVKAQLQKLQQERQQDDLESQQLRDAQSKLSEKYSDELQLAEARAAEARRELETLRETQDTAAAEMANVTGSESADVLALKQQLQEAVAARKRAETVTGELEAELKTIRADLAKLKDDRQRDHNKLQTQQLQLQQQGSSGEQEVQEYRHQLASLQKKYDEALVEKGAIVQQMTAVGEDDSAEVKLLKGQLDALNNTTAALGADNQRLSEEIIRVQKNLSDAKQDLVAEAARYRELQTSQKQQLAELEKMRGSAANEDELVTYKVQLKEAQEKLEEALQARRSSTARLCDVTGDESEDMLMLKKELKDLSESEAKLSSENSRLTEELGRLRTDVAALNRLRVQDQVEIQSLQAEQHHLLVARPSGVTKEDHEEEIDKYRRQVQDMQVRLEQAQAAHKDAATRISAIAPGDSADTVEIKNELQRTQQSLAAAEGKLADAQADMLDESSKLRTRIGTLNDEIASLKERNRQLQDAQERQLKMLQDNVADSVPLKDHQAEVDGLLNQIKEQESKLDGLRKSHDTVAASIAAISGSDSEDIVNLKRAFGTREQELVSVNNDLQSELTKAKEKLKQVNLERKKDGMKLRKQEVAVLESRSLGISEAQHEEELQGLRDHVQELEMLLEEAAKARKDAVERVVAITGDESPDILLVKNEYSKMEAEYAQQTRILKKDVASLKNKVQKFRAEKERLQEHIRNLETSLQEDVLTRKSESQLMIESEDLTEELDGAKKQIDALQAKLKEAVKARKDAAKRMAQASKGNESDVVVALKKELASSMARLSTVEQENDTLRQSGTKDVDTLKSRITKLKKMNAQTEQRMKQMDKIHQHELMNLQSGGDHLFDKEREEMEEQIDSLKLQMKDVHQSLEEALASRESSRKRMAEIKGDESEVLAQLKEELGEAVKALNHARSQNVNNTRKLNAQIASLRTKLQRAKRDRRDEQIRRLQDQRKSMTAETLAAAERDRLGPSASMASIIPADYENDMSFNSAMHLDDGGNSPASRAISVSPAHHTSHTSLPQVGGAEPPPASGPSPLELLARLSSLERAVELQQEERTNLEREVANYQQRYKEALLREEDAQSELEVVRQELKDETERTSLLHSEQAQLAAELEQLEHQLRESRQREERFKGEISKETRKLEKYKESMEAKYRNVGKLQSHLNEKTQALEKSHTMLSSLQDVIANLRAKESIYQERVQEAKESADDRERWWQRHMAEQEAGMTKVITKKLTEQRELHKDDLKKQRADIEKLEKKLRKADVSIQKVKERYDLKVLQYEELLSDFEQHKLRVLESQQSMEAPETQKENISKILKAHRVARVIRDEGANGRTLGASDTVDAEARMLEQSVAAKKFSMGSPDDPPLVQTSSRSDMSPQGRKRRSMHSGDRVRNAAAAASARSGYPGGVPTSASTTGLDFEPKGSKLNPMMQFNHPLAEGGMYGGAADPLAMEGLRREKKEKKRSKGSKASLGDRESRNSLGGNRGLTPSPILGGTATPKGLGPAPFPSRGLEMATSPMGMRSAFNPNAPLGSLAPQSGDRKSGSAASREAEPPVPPAMSLGGGAPLGGLGGPPKPAISSSMGLGPSPLSQMQDDEKPNENMARVLGLQKRNLLM